MFQKFYESFNALNQEALKRCDEDLTDIEAEQIALFERWLDYMLDHQYVPNRLEMNQFLWAASIVARIRPLDS